MPNNEPKKRRGCLIPLAIFAVVLIAIIGGIAAGVSGTAGQKPKSLLAETIGLTEQQERDLLEVFDACGVLEVKEVTQFKEGESQTSYHVRDVETDHYRGMDGTIVVWLDNGTKAPIRPFTLMTRTSMWTGPWWPRCPAFMCPLPSVMSTGSASSSWSRSA